MLKPQKVLEALQELTAGRDDVVWTTGVGQHQMWAMQYIAVRPPAHVHHLGRARDDGLRHSRPRSAPRPLAPTRRSSASTATAASR